MVGEAGVETGEKHDDDEVETGASDGCDVVADHHVPIRLGVEEVDEDDAVDNDAKDEDENKAEEEDHGGGGSGDAENLLGPGQIWFEGVSDGILAAMLDSGLEVGPDGLLLGGEIRQVPLPGEDGVLPLPALQEQRSPDGHDSGEDDSGDIVKDVGGLGELAAIVESRKVAADLADGTEPDLVLFIFLVSPGGRVAHLSAGYVAGYGSRPVDDAEKADEGGGDESFGVEGEPGKVESDLLAEVVLDERHGLVLEEARGLGPILVQHLTVVLLRVSQLRLARLIHSPWALQIEAFYPPRSYENKQFGVVSSCTVKQHMQCC